MEWHAKSVKEVFGLLGSSKSGLSDEEASERLEKYGKNVIEKESGTSPLKIFLNQFKDFLILILIAAAVISYLMSFIPGEEGHIADSILIGVILAANAVIGFVQEYRAEKGILALKKLSAPRAHVIRNGLEEEVSSENLVPGDILVLEQGDKVTADARIFEDVNLETDESALTGESMPVLKSSSALPENTPLGERKNMVFMDTIVTRGRARAVVVETGMNTELGHIANQIAEAEEKPTPFQLELDSLGKKIGIGILLVIVLVAGIQIIFIGGSLSDIFLTAISLAVAAVPEGLPAIVTLALTIGVRKMSKNNALARKLPVAESLGSVNTICTDKTGTLTENSMTVTKLFFSGKEYTISRKGKEKRWKFFEGNRRIQPEKLEALLKCGLICNDAVRGSDEHGKEKYIGDPTEIALLVSAEIAGIDTRIERQKWHRETEVPFSSDRKMMTVVCRHGKTVAYSKGAPEIVLGKCSYILEDGKKRKMTEADKKAILAKNSQFGKEALRVLAFASRNLNGKEKEIEKEMVFLGLQGMIDPPRMGVKEAITDCRKAGIKVIMITGDNINTAMAIGKELGFSTRRAISGLELEKMSDEELGKALEETEIFARVSPAHKVKVLRVLQDAGNIVAMTGDGVNDAPALKRADVGVSMGVRGTDVAKETSDLILLDDNFVTIRNAVAEGRGIFDNIKKFVNYLLSSNTAEVLVVFLFTLFAMNFRFGEGAIILTAAQLLWINLLTDGLPAVALGLDPKAENIMKRKPRKKNAGVIDSRMAFSIVMIGLAMTVTILGVFFFEFFDSNDSITERFARAQTMVFTCFIVYEMVRVQTVRSYFGAKLFSNKWLWAAVSSSLVLQLALLYTPIGKFFHVIPLGVDDWAVIAAGTLVFIALSILISKAEKSIFQKKQEADTSNF